MRSRRSPLHLSWKLRFRWGIPLGILSVFLAVSAVSGSFRPVQEAEQSSALKRGAATPLSPGKQRVRRTQWGGPESGSIPGATVQRDFETGHIRRIRGYMPVPGAQSPRAAAESFLLANRGVLGLSDTLTELRHMRSIRSLGGFHEVYEQVYAGTPVIGGRISVHMGRDLAVTVVNNDLVPITKAGGPAFVGPSAPAVQAAVAKVAAPAGPAAAPRATAGVFVLDGRPVPVWKVTFRTRAPAGDWESIVDARSNTVLSIRNVAKFVNGQGMVFDPSPVVTSGVASLTDNSDLDLAQLNNQRVSVVLKGLDGSGKLQGQFVSTAPTTSQVRANQPTNVFNYTRFDDRFEEVMCYYHIDTIQRYIQSLGFTNINNRVVGADVNGITEDNSFYSPSSKEVTFGTGGVDDAEDADIIYHEMGHAIQDDQSPGFGESEEGGAMGEGFGDYWAGSHSANMGAQGALWNPFVAEWDAVTYNAGNPAFLRRLDSAKKYPDDVVGQVHADGEIWSACLWQIWNQIGKSRADTIILESHFSLSPFASFEDGANSILTANSALYGGQDQAALKGIFMNRGILAVVETPTNLAASLSGQSQADLTWADNSGIETGFKIERRIGGGEFTELTTVGANVTAYQDPGLASDMTFTYRVRAYTPDGTSRPSNEASVQTPLAVFKVSGTVTKDGSGFAGTTVTASATGEFVQKQSISPALAIPDNNTTGIDSAMAITGGDTILSLKVGVNITHTYRGDLEIRLVHPDGTTLLLKDSSNDSNANVNTVYPDLTLPAESLDILNGKAKNGTWKLRVRDVAAADTGTLQSWNLSIKYSGGFSRTGNSGADGKYTISDLQAATYTLTPAKTGETFTPVSSPVTVGPDKSGVDFSAGGSSPSLSSLSVSPSAVTAGQTSTGTVTISTAAASDTVVSLSSNNAAATVPASVTILSGQTQASFTVTTTTVAADTGVTLSAILGATTKTAAMTVLKARAVSALALSPTSVVGGGTSTGTVTLDTAAPAGGTSVALSSNKLEATVPVSVTVLEGATTADFTVTTVPVSAQVIATISGTLNGTKTKALTIKRLEALSVTLTPANVGGGSNSTGTVTLNGPAPAGGKAVALASDKPQGTVPASVTVAEGATSATFTIGTSPVSAQVVANISATLGVKKSKALTIKPPSVATMALSPTSVFGGSSSTGTVTLNGAAPAGGTVVSLTSSKTEATISASVTIPAGSNSTTFAVNTVVVYANVTVTISASAGGVSKSSVLTVKSHLVKSVTLNPTIVKGGAGTTGKVILTAAAGPGGVVVTLSCDKTEAAVPTSVTVPAGATEATFPITTTTVGAQVKALIKGTIGTSKGQATLTINP